MKKKIYDNCNPCNVPEEKELSMFLDTSSIFYRWKSTDDYNLNCLGLTSGTDLTTIIQEIDKKLCEVSGFNLVDYNLGCLGLEYDIFSFKDFAEAVSKELCSIKDEQFSFKLDTLNANIQRINKPELQDSCIGYSFGDTLQVILQKLLDKVCEIDNSKKQIVSSPSIITIDTNTIDLKACGEKDHTISADVKVSQIPNNKIEIKDDGLYVPALSDTDIGLLLDRINSVPALKEKLCNICSFNQGVGGSLNRIALCSCTLKIESVSRYNVNNYSVIINTVDLGIAPYKWEVRNSLNVIIASGNTTSESSILETFEIPSSASEGEYTIRYTSLSCDCTDVKSFYHTKIGGEIITPKIISALSSCIDDSNIIIVVSQKGSNPEVTTIIRNSQGIVLYTRTNNSDINEYEITANGIYIVTLYDSDNNLISSQPVVVTVTCISDVDPPEDICVTYSVTNSAETNQTIYYRKCSGVDTSSIIDQEGSAILCMIKNSFIENENITFTEISSICDVVCSFDINSVIIECN